MEGLCTTNKKKIFNGLDVLKFAMALVVVAICCCFAAVVLYLEKNRGFSFLRLLH